MTQPASTPIADVRLGAPRLYLECIGDTFDPVCSTDGSLYFLGNDGSGWHQTCRSNLFFNRAWGADPFNLQGETINCMSEYGSWAKKGPDGCTWKSSGAIEVDGAFYLVVGRHRYGTDGSDPFRRQSAERASIIRSSDGGQTWVRTAQQNYDQPMFASGRFATPYFIHYGMDGQTPAVHNAERYIYATANNGFWCNGDNYILGRVERRKISRLDPADWQFYTGGDGMQDAAWSSQPEQAALIIDNPLKCGEAGATYIPAIDRYILIAWHYPGDPNVDAHISHFIYYESPTPWGPWSAIHEDEIHPHGWYCPRVLTGWQAASGEEVQTVLVTGGDYYETRLYYCLTVVPLSLKTDGVYPAPPPLPQPAIIRHGDIGEQVNQIQYSGSWQSVARENALDGTEHCASTAGDSFTITFTGSQIKWYASKENCQGTALVTVDGKDETLAHQWTYCRVPQYRRLLFDSGKLEPGLHTFTVRVTGQKHELSNGQTIIREHEGQTIAHDFVEVFP
jgi:hypothetical protein